MNLIYISNQDQDHSLIEDTNYWDCPLAADGKVFCSVSCGTFRLLVPPSLETLIEEIGVVECVIVSRGMWTEFGKMGFEFLFEDNSDTPYSIQTLENQVIPMPAKGDHGRTDLKFDIYIKSKKNPILSLPCRFRNTKSIPCMKKWEEATP